MSRHPITAAIAFLLVGLTGRAEVVGPPFAGTDTDGLITRFGTSGSPFLYPSAMPLLNGGTIVPGNAIPFGFGGDGINDQQVYEARGFPGSLALNALQFRPANGTTLPSGFIYPSVVVTLSVTPLGEDRLSTDLSRNVGSGATTVFAGPLTPSLTGPDPSGFNFVIPFTTSFAYDPAAGNLLVEIDVGPFDPAAVGAFWETGITIGDGTSRAYRIVSAPSLPPSVPAPRAALLLAIGLGLTAFGSRYRNMNNPTA